MKILDIPQSGKRGLTVSQQGRFGQISRALALVSNPRPPAQVNVRNIFASVTAAWRSLTQEQQLAWNAAAQAHTSTPRCGTSGPLTGFLFFNKINCVLATFGEARVVAPPAAPVFPPASSPSSSRARPTRATARPFAPPPPRAPVAGHSPLIASSARVLPPLPAALTSRAFTPPVLVCRPPARRSSFLLVSTLTASSPSLRSSAPLCPPVPSPAPQPMHSLCTTYAQAIHPRPKKVRPCPVVGADPLS